MYKESILRIRKASSDGDIQSILEVQKTCYHPSMCESYEVFESILGHGWSYVAVDATAAASTEKIVGYLVAHPWHTLAYPPRLHECLTPPPIVTCLFLHDMAVRPSYCNQGVAHELFRTFCKSLTKYPIPHLPSTFMAVNGTAEKHVHATHLSCDLDIIRSYKDASATYMMYTADYIQSIADSKLHTSVRTANEPSRQ